MNRISSKIEKWLTDYLKSSGQKGFVVGVSGGIDSAVVSTLCANTGKPTILVSLPIKERFNSLSNEHIKALCENYKNVKSVEIDLTKTFDSFFHTVDSRVIIDDLDDTELRNLKFANLRSRMRMMSLYFVAQSNSMLVVGTGNKIEDFGIGFYTKYGDGGVDISPIADLMKSEVYDLGRYLGVSESILKSRPTDGLWVDGRTDEDQIGATYDELEWAMRFIKTGILDYERCPDIERQKEVMDIYKRRNSINQHKMLPIPICEMERDYRDNLIL